MKSEVGLKNDYLNVYMNFDKFTDLTGYTSSYPDSKEEKEWAILMIIIKHTFGSSPDLPKSGTNSYKLNDSFYT